MSDDLKKRVEQFQCFELPGHPMSMHMGTSYLVNDLWKEIERMRAELDDAQVSGLKSEASIIKLCAEFNAVEIKCRKMKKAADHYLERAESAEVEVARLTAERDRAIDRIAAMAAEMEGLRAQEPVHQYFYRNAACQATDAFGPDCICWHNEGTGPFKHESHDSPLTSKDWRVKPTPPSAPDKKTLDITVATDPAVNGGYVLVPVNPTEQMIAAMEKQWMCGANIDMAKREYKAALAAAPKPEDE